MSFIIADEDDSADITIDTSDEIDTTDEKVDLAYECLENLVGNRTCDKLSLEEMIFTVMAIGDCKSELKDESNNNQCWPKSGCNIKSTAQAILALDRAGSSTSDAEDWLLSQNQIPPELEWYLQIDSLEETICSITYSGNTYDVSIGEDKEIGSGAGSCLSLSERGLWLKVGASQTCYDYEYEISCDKSFSTSLLFKKQGSSLLHVLEGTQTASASGTTTEKVNSACFAQSGACSYEGSLWATLILDYLDEDVEAYLSYLISMAEDNDEVLSDTFLYLLTGSTDFKTSLLEQQINNQYWDVSRDKFYDTALALYAFPHETPQEKTSSMDWLLEPGVQDDDGCWKGNIRNTAFLLYSIWPEGISGNGGNGGITTVYCEPNYFCMPAIDCEGVSGNILSDYSCDGTAKCCDTPLSLESCSDLGGEVCNKDTEFCTGHSAEALDTDLDSVCCIGGHCEDNEAPSECELAFGNCRISCANNEESSVESCDNYGEVCCTSKVSGQSYIWVWILSILIVLVLLGIFLRSKLTPLWFRIKSLFGGKSKPGKPPKGPGPAILPSSPQERPRPMSRTMLPPRRPPVRRPAQNRPNEMDDVLKKLKDMSK